MLRVGTRYTSVLLVLLTVSIAAWVGCSKYEAVAPDAVLHPETGFTFPPLSEINRINTTIILDPVDADTIRTFDVPKHCWADILGLFSPSELDNHTVVMSAEGELTILTQDGKQVHLYLYGLKNNLWFRVGRRGPYYHGGSLSDLFRVFESAYRESEKK
jgi:hypothetical protein